MPIPPHPILKIGRAPTACSCKGSSQQPVAGHTNQSCPLVLLEIPQWRLHQIRPLWLKAHPTMQPMLKRQRGGLCSKWTCHGMQRPWRASTLMHSGMAAAHAQLSFAYSMHESTFVICLCRCSCSGISCDLYLLSIRNALCSNLPVSDAEYGPQKLCSLAWACAKIA